MKKHVLITSLLAMLMVVVMAFTACTTEGTGKRDNDNLSYKKIRTLDDLLEVELDPTANYKLMDDIDCGGTILRAIGTEETPYSGTFNGNGYTIKNFKLAPGLYTGVFGYVTGVIKNLNIADFSMELLSNYNVADIYYMGGIAAFLTEPKVEEPETSETEGKEGETAAEKPEKVVAGGIIQNCTAINGDFKATTGKQANMGLIVGYCKGATVVENCVAAGSIYYYSSLAGTADGFGGIVGKSDDAASVVDKCLADVRLDVTHGYTYRYYEGFLPATGTARGGYVGIIAGYDVGTVSNCMSLGSINHLYVYGANEVCGWGNIISNCYASDDVNIKNQALQFIARESINRSFFLVTLNWSEDIWNLKKVDFTLGENEDGTAKQTVYPSLK